MFWKSKGNISMLRETWNIFFKTQIKLLETNNKKKRTAMPKTKNILDGKNNSLDTMARGKKNTVSMSYSKTSSSLILE